MQYLSERDKKLIWHPFTQAHTAPLPISIISGKGAKLYDSNNKSYLDLISSWWVNLHGHAHPALAESIYMQALKLEHIHFSDCTHEPAVLLCEQLKTVLPTPLTRFFFSDNGSTAVEVALKMSYQYWVNQGMAERTLFISFDGGYHGDTFGAMSVGKSSKFFHKFEQLLFTTHSIPYPATWEGDLSVEEKEEKSLDYIKTYLELHNHKIAAFIAEPIIQGASGMRICRIEFFRKVINLFRQYNILIIFDEVMTGFYRTGSMFALDKIGITPDFICLSKGLTGGFMPLALTITTDNIYNAFLSDSIDSAFLHGHSYTANPLGCSVALCSLHLLQQADTKSAISNINKTHKLCLDNLLEKTNNILYGPRILGTIAAFNLYSVDNTYNFPSMQTLKQKFLNAGLLLRPLGNVIYIMPPYCITTSELIEAYDLIYEIVKHT